MKHRRGLGVTAAEWDYICELWSYWRSAALPAPSVEALAKGLGVDQSTIRRYRAGLENKGLLRVVPAGPYNRYDLRPLIDAAVGLDRLQGDQDDQTMSTSPEAGPCDPPPDDRAEIRAYKEIENKFDYDSIPPYPPLHGNARFRTQAAVGQPEDPDDQTLTATISALGDELGDDAPASSMTRACNLRRDAGASVDRFLALLDEAAARTRDRQASIIKRGRDGLAVNGMPYLFAILQDLLRPAPPQTAHDARGPHEVGSRWRDDGRSRRRRRDDGRHEPCGSWPAWSDSPERLPITEDNVIWHAALEELSVVLTAENFNTWLATTRVLAQEGDLLRIAVPQQFNKDWLEVKLHGKVTNALQRLDYERLGIDVERVARVKYVVEAAACADSDARAS